MARAVERLNALAVSRMTTPGVFPDGGGLYVQVSKTGTKSYLLRYSRAGKESWMGLGSARTFTLAEARARAAEQRKLLADGLDPLGARRVKRLAQAMAESNIVTFDKAAEEYITHNADGWTNIKHVSQWRNTLKTYASPVLGRVPVSDITPALVLRVLRPIWSTKTETATRVRGRIEAVLDYAKTLGWRTGENPAAWKGQLQQALPAPRKVTKAGNHAALPWLEIGAFMSELRTMPGAAAIAAELIVLTAARTSEVIEARWDEFDLTARVWSVPPERMKAGRPHRVPLSEAALAVLARARGELNGKEFVFPNKNGDSTLSNMACLALLRRMGWSERTTMHGMRSTFRDWAAERTNFPGDVVEMALAHSISNATEAAYRRGDLFEKRTALMTEWAAWCAVVHRPAEVVPITRAAA